MTYDIIKIREQFPSLKTGNIYFDNPGGTQVPQTVIDAIAEYYRSANANVHGFFETSARTDETVKRARESMARFLNATSSKEIIFGQNMTTLTFHLARSITRIIKPGDEVIVTRLDHDANIAPWLTLEEAGAKIRWLEFSHSDCTLDLAQFEKLLSKKTRLVAVGYASNALGTINPLKKIIDKAHSVGATVFVDAVHYAPHGPIDVQALDCDYLSCSAYKFYGPHIGILYGKQHLLDNLRAYKVRPAPNKVPEKFETGTQNHEALAGVGAAVSFLANIRANDKELHDPIKTGNTPPLKPSMDIVREYEAVLFKHMFSALRELDGIRIYGICDTSRFSERTPTLAFTSNRIHPHEIAKRLGRAGIFVWSGHYYALELMEQLGIVEQGGAVRVGLALYNTVEEVEKFIAEMRKILS